MPKPLEVRRDLVRRLAPQDIVEVRVLIGNKIVTWSVNVKEFAHNPGDDYDFTLKGNIIDTKEPA
jgi:hypothetical protein